MAPDFLRVFNGHGFHFDGHVGDNRGVDAAFDFGDFFRADALRVGNVEAGQLGVLQAAFLFDVCAQNIAQGFVHQVGNAVVAHDAVADVVVDFGGYGISHFQTT